MSLVIELPSSVEAQIESEARTAGVSPEEYVQNLVARAIVRDEEDIDAKLGRWQKQDGKTLLPVQSAASLFAEWDAQASGLSDLEREFEDRLWNEVIRGINTARAEQGMRTL